MILLCITELDKYCLMWYSDKEQEKHVGCTQLGSLLLTWFNFNLSMDKLSYAKVKWLHHWNLGMDKLFHPRLPNVHVGIQVEPCPQACVHLLDLLTHWPLWDFNKILDKSFLR